MSSVQLLPEQSVSPEDDCFFIAEIGQNHQGNLEIAKKIINAAKLAGADCVKFQKTSLPDKFNKDALNRSYISEHSWGKTYGEHKEYLEFSEEEFQILKLHAESVGIAFTATPKDIPSLDFLIKLGVPFIKIGSGDSEDFVLLRKAAEYRIPLVISTGMLDMKTVHCIYELIKSYHNNFILLHCVSSYPTKPEDVNLRNIEKYREMFPDINIGYSGHEEGNAVSIAAVALGAKVIERHITLDKSQKGSDHACSLLPEEFKSMVDNIRIVQKALKTSEKHLLDCEKPCYSKLGKSLVAARNLSSETELKEDCIKIKVSYPKGISAKYYDEVIGKKLKRAIENDESIFEEDIEW